MASAYDTAVAALSPTNSWFFRDTTSTATATAGAVNGTYTNGYLNRVVSPLARDNTAFGSFGAPIAGVHLDGTSGSVNLGTSAFPFNGTTSFSIAMLFRIRAEATLSEMRLADKSAFVTQVDGWAITIDPAVWRVVFQRWGPTGVNINSYSSTLTPQQWYHLVVTYDGSNQRLYLDGVLQNTVPDGAAVNTTTAMCALGASVGRGGYFFDGEIGPTAIWNGSVLSAANAKTLSDAAFTATGTQYTLGVSPCTTMLAAGGVLMAGDTLTVPYNGGTPYVETQSRFVVSSSAFKNPGTKLAPINIISDQAFPYTNKPVIQFGSIGTGTSAAPQFDLRGIYKLNITEQPYINITGLRLTEVGDMVTTFDDRLVGFWNGPYGAIIPEVQTLTASGTGTFTLNKPSGGVTATISTADSAATVQANLRADTLTLNDIGVSGTWAGGMVFTFNTTGNWPYSQGPMNLLTANTVSGTPGVTPVRNTAGSKGSRWYQCADFCTMAYCQLDNCYQPAKISRATGSTFTHNTFIGANVAIGCFNSTSPTFSYNYFLCNRTSLPAQADAIQTKGGTRNARIYGNLIRVPSGSTAMSVGIYVGGGSNDPSGLYDWTSAGYEGYNNACWGNVLSGETAGRSFSFGGICISSADAGLVTHNTIINAGCATRAMMSSNAWPNINFIPKVNNPVIVNNLIVNCDNDFGYNNGSSDVTGTLTFDYNFRRTVTTTTAQTHTPAGDGGDPLFVALTTDWRVRTNSPVRQKGTVPTQTAFGTGYDAGTIDAAHDYVGLGRHAPSDLGAYEAGTVPRLRPRR